MIAFLRSIYSTDKTWSNPANTNSLSGKSLEIRGDDFHACSSQFQSFQAFNRFAPFKMFKSQRLGEGGDVSGILETSEMRSNLLNEGEF